MEAVFIGSKSAQRKTVAFSASSDPGAQRGAAPGRCEGGAALRRCTEAL